MILDTLLGHGRAQHLRDTGAEETGSTNDGSKICMLISTRFFISSYWLPVI